MSEDKPSSVSSKSHGKVRDFAVESPSQKQQEVESGDETTDDEVETSQHSSSIASTIIDGTSLTGAKSRIEDAIRFASYQETSRKLPTILHIPEIMFFADIVQLLSFAIDPTLFYWSDIDRSLAFSDASAPIKILRVLRYSRGLLEFNLTVFIILTAMVFFYLSSLIGQVVLVWNGALGVRFLYGIINLVDSTGPSIAAICGTVMLLGLYQGTSTASGIVIIICSAIGYIGLQSNFVHSIVYSTEFRPTNSNFAVTLSRYHCIPVICKVLLTLLSVVLNGSGGSGISHGRIIAYSIITFVLFTTLLGWHVYFQGYFKSIVNYLYGIVFGACCIASLFQFIATICSSAVGPILLIVAVVFLVPGGFLGFFLCKLRMKFLHKRTLLITPENVGKSITKNVFRSPIEVDLATRFIYNAKHIDSVEINRAEMFFKVGTKHFRESPFVHLLFALFLCEIKQDGLRMKRELIICKSLKPRFDIDYQLYCISMAGQGKDTNEDTEIDLLMAKLHHSAAKKSMTEFWAKVSRMRNFADPEPLLATVSNIDHHEQMAENIFKKLLSGNEKSVPILRAYAFFLQDIRDDKEQAELLFQVADEIEDAAVKARRKHEARKAKHLKRKQNQQKTDEVHVTVVDMQELNQLPGTVQITEPQEHHKHEERENQESSANANETMSDKESTFSVESSASSAEHTADSRNRILQYKQRIVTTQSHAVKSIFVSLMTSFLLIFAIGIAAFVVSLFAAEKMKTQSVLLIATADAQHRLMEAFLHNRLVAAKSPFSSADILTNVIAKLGEQFQEISKEETMWNTLDTPILIKRYSAGNTTNFADGRFYEENTTFWTAAQMSLTAVKEVTRVVINGTSTSIVRVMPSTRFLLENVLQKIIPLFDEFIAEQIEAGTELQSFVKTSLCTIFPIAFVFCMVTSFGIFLPSLNKVQKERASAVSLFAEIPKSTCINIHTSLAAEKDKLEEKYKSSRVAIGERHSGVVKQITKAYVVIMVLLFGFVTMTMLALIFLSNLGPNTGQITRQSAKRYQAVIDLAYLTTEYTIKDTTTWVNTSSINEEYNRVYKNFRDASHDLRLKYNELSLGNEIKTILYEKQCPSPLDCTGLMELLEIYASATQSFSNLIPELQTRSHTLYNTAYTSYTVAHEWLQERLEGNLKANTQAPENIKLIISISLALSAAVFFVAFMIIRPIVRSLEVETSRGFLMLLKLPLNVLLGIEEIKSFLENGFTDYQSSSKEIVEEQEQRTKVILDGSKDAVVMMNERLDITLFNPAAEQLLGFATEDVLGQPFLALLDSNTKELFKKATEEFLKQRKKMLGKKDKRNGKRVTSAGLQQERDSKRKKKKNTQFTFGEGLMDLMAVKKDGKKVPVLISAVSASTTEGSHFALFIKDISNLKEHEEELQRERHRADLLLKNILPEAIAEILKRDPNHTVAKQFESVTVLFADIVEFTPKASGMSPEKLVGMLNGLFSLWDSLCIEHGIEKIKTIGDCFMAACGVPIIRPDHAKCVVEFAVAMLDVLEEYNKSRPNEPQLQIRIGINTGSVVAGVIGKTKFQFDMWGDAVNVAARVETAGLPNRVQVSQTTHAILKDVFPFESRGKIALKGKGEQECFLLLTNAMKHPETSRAISASINQSTIASPQQSQPTSTSQLKTSTSSIQDIFEFTSNAKTK